MIQYLKGLLRALKRSSLDNHETSIISSDEVVARFFYQKSDYYKETLKAKPKVFLPMLENGIYETSVCRVSSISEKRIWDIADTARHPMEAKGVAKLSVDNIVATGLSVEAAPEPEIGYPEHAVILGWHIEKDKQLELAVGLASKANSLFHP